MKTARLTTAVAILALTTACATERMVAPERTAPGIVSGIPTLVPFLYVVDGVRLQRDQVPALTASQVESVEVIKGRTALARFGPDASYGVILITTRPAAAAQ